MNGFQCNMTGAKSTKKLATPRVARRYVVASIPSSSHDIHPLWPHSCGAEPELNLPARPDNCTYGAKSPLFWNQQERCNMFEGYYSPPYYNDLYNFVDGAQNDIFEGSAKRSTHAESEDENLLQGPHNPGKLWARHRQMHGKRKF